MCGSYIDDLDMTAVAIGAARRPLCLAAGSELVR